MKLVKLFLVVLSIVPALSLAAGKMKVVTSTTDIAWAVDKIGGEHVEVRSLLKGTENPHYVDAVPEFIRLASDAQVVFSVGLDLEIGWLPKVLSRSGNAQVQPGGKGYVELGKAIPVLEKPSGPVDRSMGDVHPSGNPHFWASPKYFTFAGEKIFETLAGLDPANSAAYQRGYARFKELMVDIQKRNERKLKAIRGKIQGPVLVEYHKEFAYFLETYDLKSLGSIEEKPGVAPSAGRLAEISLQAKNAGIKFALASDYNPKKTLERFNELSGITVISVPMSVVPAGRWKDYGELNDHVVDLIVKAFNMGAPTPQG